MDTPTLGSKADINLAASYSVSSCFLSSTRCIITYSDGSKLYAKVLTVSGTTVSAVSSATEIYGSSINSDTRLARIDDTHFVVAYSDSSGDDVRVRYGTLSDTTLSFGTEETVDSGTNKYVSVDVLDSSNIVVSYSNSSNNIYSCICTISGTTISAGTPQLLRSAGTDYQVRCRALDSTHFIQTWRNSGSSNRCESAIGVVSGTSITYGSVYVVESGSTSGAAIAPLSATKVLISFVDGGDSNYAKSIVGNIANDDEITYGTASTFKSSAVSAFNVSNWDNVALNDTYAIISYNITNNLYIIGAEIDGTTITYSSEVTASGGPAGTAHSSGILSAYGTDGYFALGYTYRPSGDFYTYAKIGNFDIPSSATDNSLFFGNNF